MRISDWSSDVCSSDLQLGEEALDLVDPGGGCRRQMDMPARALGQPVADGLGLVRGVVVHDEMDVEVFGDRRFDLVQEATELLRAVAAIAFADDASGGDVERCEQGGHAVALVIMAAPLQIG